MSINWVMLSPQTNPPYTPLPNEQHVFTSPPRIALSLSTPAHYPGKQQQPFSVASSTGVVYLTNRRIIYIPEKSTEQLQSLAAPLLNMHDSHVTAPFFGPNQWLALLQPTHGGGIPVPSTGVVEIKLTFKDGGAFDFHSHYERIRERLQQVVEVSRVDGNGSSGSRVAMNGIDTSNLNLDDLPAYQEQSDGPLINPAAPPQQPLQPTMSPTAQAQRDSGIGNDRPVPKPTDNAFSPPNEPPPGYEETQISGLQDELERRLDQER